MYVTRPGTYKKGLLVFLTGLIYTAMKNKKTNISTRQKRRDLDIMHRFKDRFVCMNEDLSNTQYQDLKHVRSLTDDKLIHQLAALYRSLDHQGVKCMYYVLWIDRNGVMHLDYVRINKNGSYQASGHEVTHNNLLGKALQNSITYTEQVFQTLTWSNYLPIELCRLACIGHVAKENKRKREHIINRLNSIFRIDEPDEP
jgi:hypothetical protein